MAGNGIDTLIEALGSGLDGRLVRPGDADYDAVRSIVANSADRRPAVIVRAKSARDVQRTVDAARAGGVELAVRGGGHSGAGHSASEGGVVLDLRDMHAVTIDTATQTAWVETGATAGEVNAATAAEGLVVGFGDTASVGVGGNFGVAVRLRFQLHEMPAFTGGLMVLPATPEVVASFVAAAATAPEELSSICNVTPAPPLPFLPPAVHGKLIVFTMLAFAGEAEAAQRALAPFRALGPIVDMVKPGPYASMFPPEDPNAHPTAATATMFMSHVDGGVARTIIDTLSGATSAFAAVQLRVLGGAAARVAADATAYAHRASPIMVNVMALYNPADRAAQETWVEELAAALRQDQAGAYVNFLGAEGPERVRAAYPGATWDRLRAIKAKYDPGNLFRLNQNIVPAT